jgi:hypothetical protein
MKLKTIAQITAVTVTPLRAEVTETCINNNAVVLYRCGQSKATSATGVTDNRRRLIRRDIQNNSYRCTDTGEKCGIIIHYHSCSELISKEY